MSIYPAKKALVAVMARVKTLCRQSTNRDRRTLTFSCKQARQTAHRGLIEGSEVQVPQLHSEVPISGPSFIFSSRASGSDPEMTTDRRREPFSGGTSQHGTPETTP
jgi:hypothetical protein